MAKSKTITLKRAKKVFPSDITRLRAHDLISLSVDKKKFLTKKEQETLQSVADKIRMGLFKEKGDVLAVRKRTKIRFKPF